MSATAESLSEQLSLLPGGRKRRRHTRLIADTPISRRTDPITSHEAAVEITKNGLRAKQQLEVLTALQQYPGSTSMELATKAKFDRWTAGRRLPELERAGRVTRGTARYCGMTGLRSITWWPVDRKGG